MDFFQSILQLYPIIQWRYCFQKIFPVFLFIHQVFVWKFQQIYNANTASQFDFLSLLKWKVPKLAYFSFPGLISDVDGIKQIKSKMKNPSFSHDSILNFIFHRISSRFKIPLIIKYSKYIYTIKTRNNFEIASQNNRKIDWKFQLLQTTPSIYFKTKISMYFHK